jgi:predicted small lipoprotein YifL
MFRAEECSVSRFDRPILRIAILAALLAVCGLLSACGRKGPLDPPPASLDQPGLTTDAEGRTLAPPGQKKRIPLDVLLD